MNLKRENEMLKQQLDAEIHVYYSLVDEHEALKKKYEKLKLKHERFQIGCFQELKDVENELAPALGYVWEDGYDWGTGDHTSVTLAMEAREKIEDQQKKIEELQSQIEGLTNV